MKALRGWGWVFAVTLGPATPAMSGSVECPACETASATAERERGRGEEEERAKEKEKEEDKEKEKDKQKEKDRADRLYQRGMRLLDDRQWDGALAAFDEVISAGSERADGALYWKAYAQNKLGGRNEALATLAELRKSFPGSRWVNEAKALEAEIRQASGQPVTPESEEDEDLKLMALNALLNTDAERAVSMLEKLLQGPRSPKFKERALFVLSQSGTPRARQLVGEIARGRSNPHLQEKAIQYLGLFGTQESRQILSEIYASSTDLGVRKAVLRSFMRLGDRERILTAAREEKSPELRREAIHYLGAMGAQKEVWELYQRETNPEVKTHLIQALFMGGNVDRMIELARGEKDPELRRRAVHHLGRMDPKRTADTLVLLYREETDPALRKEILHALFVQNNAKALVEIARAEKDPQLRKDAVSHLSRMKSKEATEFLLEILNR